MPRKPDIDRPTSLHISLPESVRGQLDIHLWSELEGRVPKGSYQTFIIELIKKHFQQEKQA